MKTALITGASRGIGQAIAISLAKNNGYIIVLNYKEREDAALAVQQEIVASGAACLTIRCDVRSLDQVKKMHETVKKTFGRTDIVISNAGVARGGLLQETSEDDYNYIMDTNLRGTYNVLKTFCPDMIENKWGRIVNISSIWGQTGAANESIYSASKAGIIGLTKALASELAPSNITVNCIAPGAIMTDMLKMLPKQTLDLLAKEVPLGRIGCPEDIANIVTHLVADESSYITGQVLNVSGGFVIT